MFAGSIVSTDTLLKLVRPRSDSPDDGRRYGLGFWLKPTGAAVMLEGWDAGVSCFTTHDPDRQLTYTVVANTSDGAQPVNDLLDEMLAGRRAPPTSPSSTIARVAARTMIVELNVRTDTIERLAGNQSSTPTLR